MLKKLLLFVAIIIGSFVQSSPSQALSLINGQTHFYTVQFRSDSRAIVYAKFVFQNSSMTVSRDIIRKLLRLLLPKLPLHICLHLPTT